MKSGLHSLPIQSQGLPMSPKNDVSRTIAFEDNDDRWLIGFIIGISILALGSLADYYVERLTSMANSVARGHINKALRIASVRNAERVAFSSSLQLESPLHSLQVNVQDMLFAGGDAEVSEEWLHLKGGPNAGIYEMKIFSSLHVDNLFQPLSLLKFYGYNEDEFRLYKMSAASDDGAIDVRSAKSWIDSAFNTVAKEHFKRSEYFLGLSSIEEGLKHARVFEIQNLRGTDGITKVVSPLIIVDAFFPVGLGELRGEPKSLSQEALLVLDDDFESLSESTGESLGLRSYASGVLQLRDAKFAEAATVFSELREETASPKVKALAGFMVVRSRFWEHERTLEESIPARFKAEETRTDEPGSSTEDKASKEPSEEEKKAQDEERAMRMMARVIAEELARAFGRTPPKSERGSISAPKSHAASAKKKAADGPASLTMAELARIQLACRTGMSSIQQEIARIDNSYWRAQTADYATSLSKACHEYRN